MKIISIVMAIVLFITLGLFYFLPFSKAKSDITQLKSEKEELQKQLDDSTMFNSVSLLATTLYELENIPSVSRYFLIKTEDDINVRIVFKEPTFEGTKEIYITGKTHMDLYNNIGMFIYNLNGI